MFGKILTATPQARELLLKGSLALSQIEHNGIRIDTEHLNKSISEISEKIKTLEEELKSSDEYIVWRREFGSKSNLGSREQLAHVVFEKLGYPCKQRTKPSKKYPQGRPSADATAFEDVDLPFIKNYLLVEKYKKANSTFLKGILDETVNGVIHPFFHLHTVSTYRGSSSNINFQNLPIRDKQVGSYIRKSFIPRKGRKLAEIDYGALEFRIAACFWNDPAMISYASDPKKDVHRDTAALCYACDAKQVGKEMRYNAKNKFVFPIIYGSYYIQCARNLWEAIDKMGLKLKDTDISLKEHLASKGITSLGACDPGKKAKPGTFEHHIQQVEKEFNDGFPVFASSKERWWREYVNKGYFQTLTGFVIQGIYSKNFLMNSPIQSIAFHCLLRSLIRIQAEIRKRQMETLLVGQIHDCILADVPDDELQDFLTMAKRIMTTELSQEWDWVVVPMEVEVDVTPDGGSWFDKSVWIEKDGIWIPKPKENKK